MRILEVQGSEKNIWIKRIIYGKNNANLEFISTQYELAKRVEQIFQCSALCSSQMCKKYLLEYTVQYCGSKFPGFLKVGVCGKHFYRSTHSNEKLKVMFS